ncbi:MAG: hypothetical protein KAW17_13155 [Candidatus Eisenbacteria sp.]|nr:hypothetical protein [Candidatus Eisenbacteria bacterium]
MAGRITLLASVSLAVAILSIALAQCEPKDYALNATSDFQEGERAEQAETARDTWTWPVVVETGILYVYGNRLQPPYVFTFEDDRLFVNGVRLHPPLKRKPVVSGPGSESSQAAHALSQEAYRIAYLLLEQGIPIHEVTDSLATIYRNSELVESVSDIRGHSFWVHWKHIPYPMKLLVPTDVPPSDFVPPTPEEKILVRLRTVRRGLEMAGILFCGKGYDVATSIDNLGSVEEEIRILLETRNPKAEELKTIYGCVAKDILDPYGVESGASSEQ